MILHNVKQFMGAGGGQVPFSILSRHDNIAGGCALGNGPGVVGVYVNPYRVGDGDICFGFRNIQPPGCGWYISFAEKIPVFVIGGGKGRRHFSCHIGDGRIIFCVCGPIINDEVIIRIAHAYKILYRCVFYGDPGFLSKLNDSILGSFSTFVYVINALFTCVHRLTHHFF